MAGAAYVDSKYRLVKRVPHPRLPFLDIIGEWFNHGLSTGDGGGGANTINIHVPDVKPFADLVFTLENLSVSMSTTAGTYGYVAMRYADDEITRAVVMAQGISVYLPSGSPSWAGYYQSHSLAFPWQTRKKKEWNEWGSSSPCYVQAVFPNVNGQVVCLHVYGFVCVEDRTPWERKISAPKL